MTPLILPTKTVEIDGERYTIRMLDAVIASNLYFKLLNVAGGALETVGTMSTPGTSQELSMRVAGALLRSVPIKLMTELRTVFANSCTVQIAAAEPKVSTVFENHFAGRMAHMSKWLIECLRVNFADFLEGDLVADLTAKFQSVTTPKEPEPAPQSPPT